MIELFVSSGNGQSATVRVKLGNTTIVNNTQTLPNGLIRATGKSDVVNNQLTC